MRCIQISRTASVRLLNSLETSRRIVPEYPECFHFCVDAADPPRSTRISSHLADADQSNPRLNRVNNLRELFTIDFPLTLRFRWQKNG